MSFEALQAFAEKTSEMAADATVKSCQAGMQKEVEELGELLGNYKATVEEYKYQEANWKRALEEHNQLLKEDDIKFEKLEQEIAKLKGNRKK